MADTDSAVVDETPAEDSPIGSQMGDGLFEDVGRPAVSDKAESPQDAPDDSTGHSDEADETSTNNNNDFDTSKIDFQRVNLDDVPESQRGIVASAQSAIRNAQSGFTRQQQQLQEELKTLREQVNNQNVSETVANTIRDMSRQDEFANLTPEQRQAIDTVKEIVGSEIKDLRDMPTMVAELKQTIQSLQQAQMTQQQQALQAEVNEARSLYGNDIDAYGQQIYALMQTANPKTGGRYTVKDAYELVSGAAMQRAQQQQTARNGVRTQTKKTVGTPAASTTVPDGTGSLTEEDALAALKNLGFE